MLVASACARREAGKAVFKKCAACHAFGKNALGPDLTCVDGRKAGTGAGYAGYSDAVKNSGITWDDEKLLAWFEADDTLVYARVGEHRYLVERPLADLEEMLGATFFRTHRRFLVNLSRIAEILPAEGGTYHVVLRDEARSVVPLSRRQAQRLREIIPW